jgi:hypothetical protein
MRDRSAVRLSVTPSTKYSCSGSPLMLAKGKTTIEKCGGPGVFDAEADWPGAALSEPGLSA